MPPLYEYRCTKCGCMKEAIRCIAQRNEPLDCDECGAGSSTMVLAISPVKGRVADPAVPRRQR